MKNHLKKLTILSLLILITSGCLNPHMPNRPPKTINEIAQQVENTAHLGAILAFQLNSVKPYRDQVCEIIQKTCDVLENINDPNSTFDLIRESVLEKVFFKIQDDGLKDAVSAIFVITFNESFHYVETHYQNLLETEKTKTVLLVSRAISHGLKKACSGS